MDIGADSTQWDFCSVCNRKFSRLKDFIIHCNGIFHRENHAVCQLQGTEFKECESRVEVGVFQDDSRLMFNSKTNEWHELGAGESCRNSVNIRSLGHANDEILIQTVLCVVKDSAFMLCKENQQIRTSAVAVSYKKSLSDTLEFTENKGVDCRAPVVEETFMSNDVGVSSEERSNNNFMSQISSDGIPLLDSIISSDTLGIGYENVASLSEKKTEECLRLFPDANDLRTQGSMEERTIVDPDSNQSIRPYYCHMCGTVDVTGFDAHTSSLEHCKFLLTRQLELGIHEFQRLFGDVPFHILIDGVEPPPDTYDAYWKRIYRCGVFNKMECTACGHKVECMKEWYKHSLSPVHFKCMYMQLEMLGKEQFLERYGHLPLQRDACLSKPFVDKMINLKRLAAFDAETGDFRHDVIFRIFDYNNEADHEVDALTPLPLRSRIKVIEYPNANSSALDSLHLES